MAGIVATAASALAASAPSIAAASASAAATTAATATLTSTLTAIATNVLTNLAISSALSLLNPQVGEAGRPIDWTLDPDGPIPFAAGRVGAAGAIVHKATFGPDLMYYGLVSVLSGAGPIKSFVAFRADEEFVTFDGNGKAVTSQWRDEMWMKTQRGLQPTTSGMTSPSGLKNGASLPGWSSSHRLNGKAAYIKIMGENSKRTAYPNGETKPLWFIEGLYGWDPRQDSTYPGGSGACRLNDPATWVYLTNPILWALKWSLGLWEGPTGKGAPQVDYQVGGIGAKVEGIDVAAFVSAANVADANGWTVAAYPTTDDDKAQVLDAFLQAGGAIYAQKAGKISCIQRAAPRTSIVTISAADTAGPIEFDTAASRINRINTLRPRFWSEANRWQMTAISEVTATAYQTEDGGKRTRGVDFPYVPSAVQCGQLAALQIANTREGIAGTIPLKPHLQRITPGDAFTISEAGFVLDGLKCLCLSTEYDPATGIHNVTFVSETDAKYPFALGQSPDAPESPTLTPTDPTVVNPPLPDDWVIVVRPPTTDGRQIPGFDLTGVVSNDTATGVLVEWALADTGPWTQAYSGPPTATTIPIVGVQPNEQYYIAVSYIRGQNTSERTIYGPFLAGDLVAQPGGDLGDTTPPAVPLGLSLSSTAITDATTGQPIVKILASWTANTEGDLAGYETEFKEPTGPAVSHIVGANRDEWIGRTGVLYSVRVRAYDGINNLSAWSSWQTVLGAGDNVAPGIPTGLVHFASLGSIFLQWTNPADSDLAAVEIFESSGTDVTAAAAVGTVNALPNTFGYYTRSGLTAGSFRNFWVRAVDTSGNRSGFSAMRAAGTPMVGTGDFAVNTLSGNVIAAGTLAGDRVIAGSIQGDRISTGTSLPGSITVGTTGVTIETVQDRSANPAARINASTTQVLPGLVQISGASTLASWRHGADLTKIAGGELGTNSVSANKLEIGARGVVFDRFDFQTNASTNTVSWSTGRVTYIDDNGSPSSFDISAGSLTWAPGNDIRYLYWVKGEGILRNTSTPSVATGANSLIVGMYYGGHTFTALYGRTIINETGIVTPSLAAITANLGIVTAGRVQSPDGQTFFDLSNARSQYRRGSYDLRLGSIGSGVVLWYGPASVGIGSETRTNGVWAFGDDGQVYYGSTVLTTGGGASFYVKALPQASRIGTRTSPGSVTTSTVLAGCFNFTDSPSPRTFLWEQVGGDNGWSITNPNGDTTAFSNTVSTGGEIKRGTFVCTVTNGDGRVQQITVGAAVIYNV